jgi:aminoglycoside 6'-N-acetyltransferase I
MKPAEDARPRQVLVRPATDEDYGFWEKMRLTLWPDCPPEQHRIEMKQVHRLGWLVALATVDGQAAGFAEVSVRSDHVEGAESSPVAYLEGWYVEPAYRRQGVGRALIEFAERWALQEGFAELASDADPEYTRSLLAHGALGFRDAGRSVHFVKRLKP